MSAWPSLDAGHETADVSMDWHATEPWVRFGTRIVLGLCCALFAGVFVFPVQNTLIISGVVTVEGDLTSVQSPQGGSVTKIFVRHGGRVEAGTVLLRLDDTDVRTGIENTSAKFNELAIQEARLLAERDQRDDFSVPESIDMTSPENVKAHEVEATVFVKQRHDYVSELKSVSERIAVIESELKRANLQLEARSKELLVNELDLSNARPLFDRGAISVRPIGPLQRDNVRIRSEIIELKALIADLKSEQHVSSERLVKVERAFAQRVASELQVVQPALAAQKELLASGTGKISLSEIRAPVTGIAHVPKTTTEGAAVSSGSALLHIMSDTRRLLIDAKVGPQHIDELQIGQRAIVSVPSLDTPAARPLEGTVRNISHGEATANESEPVVTAQIEVPGAALLGLDPGRTVSTGMMAEIQLEATSRSLLSVAFDPLTSVKSRSVAEP